MKQNKTQKNPEIWQKLPSGMDCYFIPMPDYEEKMAAIVVKSGANALTWKGGGQDLELPQGTAHFIEHRLFRQKWGDAFAAFSKQGASANAFTDGEKTVYYFSCQENFMENLSLLLSFVQNPYFTSEETEQEKSIIGSEITMYDDDADWQVYYQLLQGMYHTHPVRFPIAGSQETIAEIDDNTLRQAYDCMYTTDRFSLICAGDFPFRKVLAAAAGVKKRRDSRSTAFAREPREVRTHYVEGKMGISRPVYQIGFKLQPPTEEAMRQRLLMGMLLELWAGESSDFYAQAYEKALLDAPLGGAYFAGEGYAFCSFSGTGHAAQEVSQLLLEHLERLRQEGIQETDFKRIRKKQLGSMIRRRQSVSGMVLGQVEWAMADTTWEEVFRLMKGIKRAEVEKLLQNQPEASKMVLSVIR